MSELTNYSQLIKDFIDSESLPASYEEDAGQWFLPLAELCLELVNTVPRLPVTIGINGCQGSGKSTLSRLLKTLLEAASKTVTVLSIDDFYLDSVSRQNIAREVHPLLATRGVPGTHDIKLALDCLQGLQRLDPGESMAQPAFNKAMDEPVAESQRPRVSGPQDLIILEGWFVGVRPQHEDELEEPVNVLESDEDPQGTWRHWVNERLGQDYQPLFQLLDLMVMLQAPGFDVVFSWRKRQEDQLRQQTENDSALSGLMNDETLQRFIQHYERLTRHGLKTLPDEADIVFTLDQQQRVTGRRDRDFSVAE